VFGGFCLLFYAISVGDSPSSCRVGWFFLMPVLVSFVWISDFSETEFHLAFGLGCFCLESLILAQDERWRRA
jgi:hypothetical protein